MSGAENEVFPAFQENNIPVVVSFDNSFVPYAGVFIQSLIDHASPEKNYDIIIMEIDISASNKLALELLAQRYHNISIRFYDPSYYFKSVDDMCSLESGIQHFPAKLYSRLLAPYILKNYEKMLVIDLDTLLKRDISELFDIELGNRCIGGVLSFEWYGTFESNKKFTNIGKELCTIREYCQTVLTMKNPSSYINTGVLVVDCGNCRKHINMEQILQTAQSRRFLYVGQDVINLLFEDKIKFIDPAWNTQVLLNPHIKHAIEAAPEHLQKEYRAARQNPYLLHYAGNPKPWVCPDVEFGVDWWETAMRTPFLGHIIARMVCALDARRDYYKARYGEKVSVWDPVPSEIKRNF